MNFHSIQCYSILTCSTIGLDRHVFYFKKITLQITKGRTAREHRQTGQQQGNQPKAETIRYSGSRPQNKHPHHTTNLSQHLLVHLHSSTEFHGKDNDV